MSVAGVDRLGPITSSQATCLFNQGKAFVGRYISRTTYVPDVLSCAEASRIHAAGLLIVSIVQSAASTGGGTLNKSMGQIYGRAAAGAAIALGQPTASGANSLYFDIESSVTPNASLVSYLSGMQTSMTALGYKLGIYSTATILNYVGSHGFCANPFWNAGSGTVTSCGYALHQTALNQSICCSSPNVCINPIDLDSVAPSVSHYGQW